MLAVPRATRSPGITRRTTWPLTQTRSKKLREMKVGLIERAYFYVFHRKRDSRPCCNDNIVAVLGCMGQNVCEAVENGLAELDDVMTTSGCAKVLDDVVPEIGREYESVMASRAHKKIIACRTVEFIAASGAQDRVARTCNGVISAIEFLSRIGVHCFRYGGRTGEI